MKNFKEISDTEATIVGAAIIVTIIGFFVFVAVGISHIPQLIFN